MTRIQREFLATLALNSENYALFPFSLKSNSVVSDGRKCIGTYLRVTLRSLIAHCWVFPATHTVTGVRIYRISESGISTLNNSRRRLTCGK